MKCSEIHFYGNFHLPLLCIYLNYMAHFQKNWGSRQMVGIQKTIYYIYHICIIYHMYIIHMQLCIIYTIYKHIIIYLQLYSNAMCQ